jgi:transmembrane 9 superfamily protein 2/4
MKHGSMLIAVVLGVVSGCHAFYLPGVAPRKYVLGEQLMVKVNTLTSSLTPLQFDYYNGACVSCVFV